MALQNALGDITLEATQVAVLNKLPAVPATGTKQDTGNASLATIATNTTSNSGSLSTTATNTGDTTARLTQIRDNALPLTSAGAITTQNLVPAGAATAGSSVEVVLSGRDTVAIQVTGTYTGQLSVQVTVDGTNWVTLASSAGLLNVSTGAYAVTIPSGGTGIWAVGCTSFARMRVTALAAVTGSAAITLIGAEGDSFVALDAPLPAGGNAIGTVSITGTPNVSIVNTPAVTNTPAVGTEYIVYSTATAFTGVVKASAGNLTEFTVFNSSPAIIYLKLYNKATAPVVATDLPRMTVAIAAGATYTTPWGPPGKRFGTGIALAITGAAAVADATAVAAGIQISGTYI